jgi:hypothetical protein
MPLAVLQVDAVFVGLAHTLRIAQVHVNRNICSELKWLKRV